MRHIGSCASALLLVIPAPAWAQTTVLFSAHPTPQGAFGTSVSQAPDVNGDGRPDIVVGASGEAVGPILIAGRVTIHSSVNGAILRTLTSPQNETYGYFGNAVALVPDITGDGKSEIAVGAFNEINGGSPVNGHGRVYLFNGATGALVRTLTSPGAEDGGRFGAALAGLADVNGDGGGDLLVGAPFESPGGVSAAGRAYLFSGKTGALVRVFVRGAGATSDNLGASVAAVPDITGDGKPDVAIGAPGVDVGPKQDAGVVLLFNSASGVFIRTLSSPAATAYGLFGSSVRGMFDLTGDGRGEVVVGAPREARAGVQVAGQAHLFNGATGAKLRTFGMGSPVSYATFGAAIARIPDADGDGRDDLAFGAPGVDAAPPYNTGRVYIFSAYTGAFIRSMGSPAPAEAGRYGAALAGLPDVNGNGKGEVIIGAPTENTNVSDVGRAYLTRN